MKKNEHVLNTGAQPVADTISLNKNKLMKAQYMAITSVS
jgi:hypothetical protein